MAKHFGLVGAAWLRRWFGAVALCALASAGCGDKDGSCAAGTENCACLTGDVECRGEGLFCAAGTCRKMSCVPGEKDCSCFPNLTCAAGDAGALLVCDRGLCREPSCEQGASGCGCYPNGTCNSGLSCAQDGDVLRCSANTCTAGEDGCDCLAGGTCTGKTASGAATECVSGKCAAPSVCAAGTTGCDCLAGGTCNTGLECSTTNKCFPAACTGKDGTTGCQCKSGDTCSDASAGCSNGICVLKAACTQGSENCGCLPNSTCTGNATSGKPLVCDNKLCVAASCLVGEKTCGCKADHTCNTGLSCNLTTGVCEDPTCVAGEVGCKCLADKNCNDATLSCGTDGLCAKSNCVAGALACRCLSDQTCGKDADGSPLTCVAKTCQNCRKTACATPGLSVPKTAYCYSPCRSGYSEDAGVYHACDADGLMRHEPGKGCLDNKTCQQGSCLGTADKLPTCKTDIDCPDFQNCVDDRCYATCDTDNDCPASLSCYRHACQAACTADASSCPEHTTCVMADPKRGYCMPVGTAPGGAPEGVVLGTFEVSKENIEFTSAHIADSFTITNKGPIAASFKISKFEETSNGKTVDKKSSPLTWLKMGEVGKETQAEFSVVVDPETPKTISLKDAATSTISRWQGVLEVRSENARLGTRKINLRYAGSTDGRWTGKMVYFANFGTAGLLDWMKARNDTTKLSNVGNGLVRRWGDFRIQGANVVSRPNIEAAIDSVVKETWKWPSVVKDCPAGNTCYPYVDPDNTHSKGIQVLTNSQQAYPVPTGASELPVTLDLKQDATNPAILAGRIVSTESLHYPGNPAISLTFSDSPNKATCSNSIANECVIFAQTLASTINIGGRYATSATTCPTGWAYKSTPWLVPGFTAGSTEVDNLRYRYECRDAIQPTKGEKLDVNLNAAISAANPIPDGVTRSRALELVDGAIIEQNRMILIVRESFASFVSAQDKSEFAAYGVMTLVRSPADLKEESYDGNSPPKEQTPPATAQQKLSCSDQILTSLGYTSSDIPGKAAEIATALLSGRKASASVAEVPRANVHYLCHDNGQIDGGNAGENGGARNECPAGSQVTYFSFPNGSPIAQKIPELPCQHDGTCQSVLDAWRSPGSNSGIGQSPLVYRCNGYDSDSNKVFCDGNRADLAADKTFYAAAPGTIAFAPLRSAVNDAFRYKTQFITRTNKTVGFAPEPCIPKSSAVPYCYDAKQIEEARDRVDCALYLYKTYFAGTTPHPDLAKYLEFNFTYSPLKQPPNYAYDGFEMMFAELLIMLGDDAYTAAAASRFDLAGSSRAAFRGSLFEKNGIDLSSAAGYEMHRLHQAAQYFGTVLERMYRIVPYITSDTDGSYLPFIANPTTTSLPSTFVTYFPKLVRASAQKARVWSEIAKRYQSINRADLARITVERAYVSAYLESVVIGSLITRSINASAVATRAQIEVERVKANRVFSASLIEMRDVYRKLTDDELFFGFTRDFIPFPALDPGDVSAFTKVFALAQQRTAVAAGKEQTALESNRSYETEAASFQSELVKLRINYENQLSEICGTMEGTDGNKYPAIARYAYLNDDAKVYGDPCGLMRTGRLYNSMGQFALVELELKGILQRYENIKDEIDDEGRRVAKQCGLKQEIANAGYDIAKKEVSLQADVGRAQLVKEGIRKDIDLARNTANALDCLISPLGSNCTGKNLGATLYKVALVGLSAANIAQDVLIQNKQTEIAELKANHARWLGAEECKIAMVDSEALINQKWNALKELDIEALKADYKVRLAQSEIRQLLDQADRVASEMDQMEEQTINVEAARNDPNSRIYKNDAILNAELAFDSAIAMAYQATKVFEYFTTQSYARLVDLFLVRMVSHGDYNLENYLTQLQDAYLDFQQQYGNPDERVDIVSLRDDIFAISRYDEKGVTLSQSDRIAAFRTRLKDVSLLDEQGYLTIPFATSLNRLSPVTSNHKIKKIEVEVVGSDVGDALGRIYLRQKGTGVVRKLDSNTDYLRFPERTAVIDPFFNGARVFGPEVYPSDRLRDRPVSNSRWDLVINQRDESVNKDINLSSVTDMRVYLYYTDFTGI